MTQSRTRKWTAASALFFIFATLAAAQAPTQPITLHIKNGSQPAGSISIYVLAGGNKFSSATTPPTGTTDSGGTFAFPPGLLTSNKLHTQMEVYEVCVDGVKTIFIIPKGSKDQLPEDTKDCKKRRIGGFYWDGGSTVTVDIGEGGGVTHTGPGGPGGPHTSTRWIEFAGGPGLKIFSGTAGNCAAFSQAFSGGTCGTSEKSFAFDVDGSVHIWHVVARGGYWRANGIHLDASGPVLGGGTDTLRSSLQPEAGYATGGFCIPVGSKFSVIPEAGAASWGANIARTETVTIGTTTTTSRDSVHVTGIGPMLGGAVHFDATRHVGFEVRYAYVQMNNKPAINEHNNIVFFNVTIRWPGK